MKKGLYFKLGLAVLATAVIGCGSGSSNVSGSGFSSFNTGGGGSASGRVSLNFDPATLPAGVDSIMAVFLDSNGQRIGEPIKVPITGDDFIIENPPSNGVALEVDYLRNGGFALFESFHRIGETSFLPRGELSSPAKPVLYAAQKGTSKWTTSLGPARFHVEALGNPGADNAAVDKLFQVKGVAYSPAPIGSSNKDGPNFGDLFWDGGTVYGGQALLDWSKVWKRDLENIRGRFNSIRVYSICSEHTDSNGRWTTPPNSQTHTKFLDACWNNGDKPVYVLVGIPLPSDCFFANGNAGNRADWERVLAATLAETKDHPAVMGYTIFNEIGGGPAWGENPAIADYYWKQVQKYSSQIKAVAPDKLAGFAYFDAPANVNTAKTYMETFGGSVDYWGVNSFQGSDIGPTLAPYKNLGAATKPVLFTEFAVPATSHRDKSIQYNSFPTQASVNSIYADAGTIHLAAQAMQTMLPRLLGDSSVAGILYFEWTDEYWKQEDGKDGDTVLYTTTKGGQEGGNAAALSQMPNGFNDEEGFGLNSPSLNNRAVTALFEAFNTGAATANNRPDILAPRTELLDTVTQAFLPLR